MVKTFQYHDAVQLRDQHKVKKLDRPIFVVGNARGGSTAVGAIINFHSMVGPKFEHMRSCSDIRTLLREIFENQDFHYSYATCTEQKNIWFDYFPGDNVFTTMGKEMIVEKLLLDDTKQSELVARLTEHFNENRFLSKAPSNTFRVKILRELFPDAKIVALVRRGVEVVGSYMGWEYRKGYRALGYIRGTLRLARKWNETITYLNSVRESLDIYTVVYDDLIENTEETLSNLFDYLELPFEDYIQEIEFEDRRDNWKLHTPYSARVLAQILMARNQKIVDSM